MTIKNEVDFSCAISKSSVVVFELSDDITKVDFCECFPTLKIVS